MTLIVSIIVILLMTTVMTALFLMLHIVRKRVIRYGLEDRQYRRELNKSYPVTDSNPLVPGFYSAHLKKTLKKQKYLSLLSNILFCILASVVLVWLIFAAIFRAKDNLVFFGDKAYMTVLSGSMETVNSGNSQWLESIGKGGGNSRIARFSLVGIERVRQEELQVGDVVVIKATKDTLIIHRIKSIAVQSDGSALFTLQGDANSESLIIETNVSFDRVVGRYTGFQSVALGVFLVYLQSDIGFISMSFAIIFLLCVAATDSVVIKCYKKRLKLVAKRMDYILAITFRQKLYESQNTNNLNLPKQMDFDELYSSKFEKGMDDFDDEDGLDFEEELDEPYLPDDDDVSGNSTADSDFYNPSLPDDE